MTNVESASGTDPAPLVLFAPQMGRAHAASFAYGKTGRPSIPPERLIKAMLPVAFCNIRGECQPCYRDGQDLLFCGFLVLRPSE